MVTDRYTEVSVQGSSKVPSRILEPTGREKARQVLIFLTTVAAVAAACMVLAGVSAFPFVVIFCYVVLCISVLSCF